MASTLGERLGEIDRVQQLAQAAKMINAFQRVSRTDPRHHPKRDQQEKEEQADKVELSQDAETIVLPVAQVEEQEVPEDPDEGGLDIAV